MEIRPATFRDAEAIAAIYNQGVAERSATFQTEPVEAGRFRRRIEGGEIFLVALGDAGTPVGVAWAGPYDPINAYYRGIAEATVYVERGARRRGVGRALLEALADSAAVSGKHKLVAKIFAENQASRRLFKACGYRQVGIHMRHGAVDGEWKDVVVVERRLSAEARPGP